jgi:hypothetical protein
MWRGWLKEWTIGVTQDIYNIYTHTHTHKKRVQLIEENRRYQPSQDRLTDQLTSHQIGVTITIVINERITAAYMIVQRTRYHLPIH